MDRQERYRRACAALRYARSHLDDAVSPQTPSTERGKWIAAAKVMAISAFAEIEAMEDAPPRDHGEPVVTDERGPDGAWKTDADFMGGTV